jgi:hypothetical protein
LSQRTSRSECGPAISFAWSLLAKKVAGGLVAINKEAALQLQSGYVLQQVLPLITFHESILRRGMCAWPRTE